MAADIRRALSPTVVFGVGLVVVGVLLMLQNAHIITLDMLRQYWPLGIVAVGIAFVLQAFLARNAGEAEQPRDFRWAPLIVVLIVGAFWTHAAGQTPNRANTDAAGTVRISAVLGGSSLVSHAQAFHGGEVTAFMGGSQLDLRQAAIAPGEVAVIDIDALMGGVVIRVPEGWQVDVGTTMIMGGVNDERPVATRRKATAAPPATEPGAELAKTDTTAPPRLTLRGTIVMGGLVIKQ